MFCRWGNVKRFYSEQLWKRWRITSQMVSTGPSPEPSAAGKFPTSLSFAWCKISPQLGEVSNLAFTPNPVDRRKVEFSWSVNIVLLKRTQIYLWGDANSFRLLGWSWGRWGVSGPHGCRLKWLSLACVIHRTVTLEDRDSISQVGDAPPSSQDLGPVNWWLCYILHTQAL